MSLCPSCMPAPTSDQLGMQLERMGVVPYSPIGRTGIKKKHITAQVLCMQCKVKNSGLAYVRGLKKKRKKEKDHSGGN